MSEVKATDGRCGMAKNQVGRCELDAGHGGDHRWPEAPTSKTDLAQTWYTNQLWGDKGLSTYPLSANPADGYIPVVIETYYKVARAEIERLRAGLEALSALDTSHLPYEKGWQDGRDDAWKAYNAGSSGETESEPKLLSIEDVLAKVKTLIFSKRRRFWAYLEVCLRRSDSDDGDSFRIAWPDGLLHLGREEFNAALEHAGPPEKTTTPLGFGIPVLMEDARALMDKGVPMDTAIAMIANRCELRSEAISVLRDALNGSEPR